MLLKLEQVPESPKGLAELKPQKVWASPITWFSNKSSGDADAAGPGTTNLVCITFSRYESQSHLFKAPLL